MKKSFIQLAGAAVVMAGAVLSSAAYAQAYIGGGIGRDHASFPSLSTTILRVPVTGAGSNAERTSYKGFGGYQFTENWGLEASIARIGDGHTASARVRGVGGSGKYNLESVTFAATGTLPLEGGFSLLGKLGVTRNHVSGEQFCVVGTCIRLGSSSHVNALWGVGAQYALSKAWALRLEFEDYGRFSGDDVWGTGRNSGSVKATDWSLSLKFSY